MSEHISAELRRLRIIQNATAWQFRRLYLDRSMRSICTELVKLRATGHGPGFIAGRGKNLKLAYIYDVEQVFAFFGGESALFHKRDRPEIFSEKSGRVVAIPRRAA